MLLGLCLPVWLHDWVDFSEADVALTERVRRGGRVRQLLAGLEPDRRRHSLEVGRKVAGVAGGLPASVRDDVLTAALLHDVGYTPTLVETGFHPVDGAQALRAMGFGPVVCDLVVTHTGSRWEATARGLTLTLIDDLSDERAAPWRPLVMWADMTTSPTGSTVTPRERVEEIVSRYVPGDPVHSYVTEHGDEMVDLAELGRVDADRLAG